MCLNKWLPSNLKKEIKLGVKGKDKLGKICWSQYHILIVEEQAKNTCKIVSSYSEHKEHI